MEYLLGWSRHSSPPSSFLSLNPCYANFSFDLSSPLEKEGGRVKTMFILLFHSGDVECRCVFKDIEF